MFGESGSRGLGQNAPELCGLGQTHQCAMPRKYGGCTLMFEESRSQKNPRGLGQTHQCAMLRKYGGVHSHV